MERRRRTGAGPGIGLPKAGRVAVGPHRLAGGGVVGGDHLVLATLLLGVEELAVDREGGPPRTDRAAP